jgi:hypothetical protein
VSNEAAPPASTPEAEVLPPDPTINVHVLKRGPRNPTPQRPPPVPSPAPDATTAVDPSPSISPTEVVRYVRWQPEFAEQAGKLVALGATQEEMADFFECSISTIRSWSVTVPEFSRALAAGRDAFTDRVVRSLAQRAIGYTFDTVKVFMTKSGDVVQVPFREHVPPDVTACIFWLKNRDKENWRDVQDHRHSGNIAVSITEEETKL